MLATVLTDGKTAYADEIYTTPPFTAQMVTMKLDVTRDIRRYAHIIRCRQSSS